MRYIILFSLISSICFAQMQPGFDASEFMDLMLISIQTSDDEEYASKYDMPRNYEMLYQSEPIGLDNQWDFWHDDANNRAAISLRGTTLNPDSWLLNFYAAMIPAKGTIGWGPDSNHTSVNYHLADHPQAAVHAGWTLGMLMLSEEIIPKMKALYAEHGTTEFYIVGHSQGGAISYLLTSHLHHLIATGKLPNNFRIKTYCAAAPKPGNLYYAYEYESLLYHGWTYNVVNSLDWVPEVPFSIQTLDDFNEVSPFTHMDIIYDNAGFFNRIGLWWVVHEFDSPTRKAQENFEKYLGDKVNAVVEEKIQGLKMPEFTPSNNYVRTGNTIVLEPSEAYRREFRMEGNNPESVFVHHIHTPYLYLLKENLTAVELVQNNIPLDTLFTVTKMVTDSMEYTFEDQDHATTIQFDSNQYIGGNNGCNSYGAKFSLIQGKFSLESEITTTLLHCTNTFDNEFMSVLQKVDAISQSGEEWILSSEGRPVMWLHL